MIRETNKYCKSDAIIDKCVGDLLDEDGLWQISAKLEPIILKDIHDDYEIQVLCNQLDSMSDFIADEERYLIKEENRIVKTLKCYGITREANGYSPWNTQQDVIVSYIIKGNDDIGEYRFDGEFSSISDQISACAGKLSMFEKYFDENISLSEDIKNFNHVIFLRNDNNLKIATTKSELWDLKSKKSIFKRHRIKFLENSLKQCEEYSQNIDKEYSSLMAKDEVKEYAEYISHAGLFKSIKKLLCNKEYLTLTEKFNTRCNALQDAKTHYGETKQNLEETISIKHLNKYLSQQDIASDIEIQ